MRNWEQNCKMIVETHIQQGIWHITLVIHACLCGLLWWIKGFYKLTFDCNGIDIILIHMSNEMSRLTKKNCNRCLTCFIIMDYIIWMINFLVHGTDKTHVVVISSYLEHVRNMDLSHVSVTEESTFQALKLICLWVIKYRLCQWLSIKLVILLDAVGVKNAICQVGTTQVTMDQNAWIFSGHCGPRGQSFQNDIWSHPNVYEMMDELGWWPVHMLMRESCWWSFSHLRNNDENKRHCRGLMGVWIFRHQRIHYIISYMP